MSLQITGVLVATSIIVCACLGLVGCGQKGNLYIPTTNPADANLIERRNTKSHFIFGSSSKNTPATSTTSQSQTVTGGSAS
ncbi:MAG: lipoprotein [Candidatus Saccharibacteria bacterium]|nr:lipoprotein [Moraxellaceae bacterium]